MILYADKCGDASKKGEHDLRTLATPHEIHKVNVNYSPLVICQMLWAQNATHVSHFNISS